MFAILIFAKNGGIDFDYLNEKPVEEILWMKMRRLKGLKNKIWLKIDWFNKSSLN